jgi:hypothetical protein
LAEPLWIADRTFADESFRIGDPDGLVVLAQLPEWVNVDWQHDLMRKYGHELKWSKLLGRWRDLSADLRNAIVRCLREALITITNPAIYHADFERIVSAVTSRPPISWPVTFRNFVKEHRVAYEKERILLDSPAVDIQLFLEDDGVVLGPIGGVEGNYDSARSIVTDLATSLKSPESVRFFGARSAAAFVSLVDPSERSTAIAESSADGRFFDGDRIVSNILARNEQTERVFDDGNQPSVLAIVDLKNSVRRRLAATGLVVLPDDLSPGVIEQSSLTSPLLQAADFAGGYARDVYLELGLQAVCEEFRAVVLNGSMVRDWSQVDRSNTAELRRRR